MFPRRLRDIFVCVCVCVYVCVNELVCEYVRVSVTEKKFSKGIEEGSTDQTKDKRYHKDGNRQLINL